MKLQRTTLVLLLLAILLGGFVYFYEIQGAPKREAAKSTKQPLFSFEEDQIKSLAIYQDDDVWEFERVGEQESRWRMKQPKKAPASSASIAFLTSLLVDRDSERAFTVSSNQRKEYGLDKPTASVVVELENQEIHQLILGKSDFNDKFLYAEIPERRTPGNVEVLLVPKDFEYAINRPMSEWLSQEEGGEDSPSSEKREKPEDSETPPSPTEEESLDTEEKPTDSEQPASEAEKDSSEKEEKPEDSETPASEAEKESPDTKEPEKQSSENQKKPTKPEEQE
ncbi:MAG: DUF4340 domain-containing protein [Coleofasciculaceae cyanobacterium]